LIFPRRGLICQTYSGNPLRKVDLIQWSRLYQYNEDDFSLQILVSNMILFQITSLQVYKEKLLIHMLLIVFMFLCIRAVWKFVKNKKCKSKVVFMVLIFTTTTILNEIKLNIRYKLEIKNFKLQTSNFKLQTSNFKLQTSNFKLQTSNFKLQTSNFKLQTANCKLQTANCKLQTSNFNFEYLSGNFKLNLYSELDAWFTTIILKMGKLS